MYGILLNTMFCLDRECIQFYNFLPFLGFVATFFPGGEVGLVRENKGGKVRWMRRGVVWGIMEGWWRGRIREIVGEVRESIRVRSGERGSEETDSKVGKWNV